MKINQLVRYGVAFLLIVLCIGAVFASYSINRIRIGGPIANHNQQISDLVADILPPPVFIIEPYLEATMIMQRSESLDNLAAKITRLHKSYDERRAYWLASAIDRELRDTVTETANLPAQQFWTELETKLIPAARQGDNQAMQASYAKLTGLYLQQRSMIDRAVQIATEQQTRLKNSASSELFVSICLLTVLALVVIATVVACGIFLVRRVVRPLGEVVRSTTILADGGECAVPHLLRTDELGEMAKAVEQFRRAAQQRADADAKSAAEQNLVSNTLAEILTTMAAGDLTKQITVQFPEAYAEVSANLNTTVTTLRAMIQAVVTAAVDIEVASREIASASFDLAHRTEGNAASLEETTAALLQIEQRIKTATESSNATVERADRAIAIVDDGRAAANGAVDAMGRVSDSARGIDTVIEGLDKIAFQTRVLAMNAAVEAGRAGDAGRGFAVVADLVSALAMRAEEEAKSARDQLTLTQTEIVAAVDAVRQVDGSLVAIAGDVGEVHALLGNIAQDTQAQSLAITEITAAVGSMDQATQQNAAMVQQTSEAARTLSAQIAELNEKASAFRFERRTHDMPVAIDRRRDHRSSTQRALPSPPPVAAPTRQMVLH